MTQSEKLQKVIEKAIKNGWNDYKESGHETVEDFLINDYERPDIATYIFSHQFAKAFWGEEEIDRSCFECGPTVISLGWKYYIQQLALTPEEERINYLHAFI